jgi:phytol kinase
MLTFVVATVGIGILLALSELLWRRKIIHGEYGRKLVHMVAGVFVATWPYFLTFEAIQLIALMATVALLLSRKYAIFHAIHDVMRKTYGEVLYPLSVLTIALLAREDWIFSVALLFVALADGMAAVVGKKYGKKKHTYKIGPSKKTTVGTGAYIVFAYIALGVGLLVGGRETMLGSPFVVFAWLPLFSAFLEAVSPYGTDNVTVPLVVVLLLNVLLAP